MPFFLFSSLYNNIPFRSTEHPEKTVVIDFTQGAGATGEAALGLSCLYIGVDQDPLAEIVVQRRLDAFESDATPPSWHRAKWANQMKWSMFTRENCSLGEIEDGQDGINFIF